MHANGWTPVIPPPAATTGRTLDQQAPGGTTVTAWLRGQVDGPILRTARHRPNVPNRRLPHALCLRGAGPLSTLRPADARPKLGTGRRRPPSGPVWRPSAGHCDAVRDQGQHSERRAPVTPGCSGRPRRPLVPRVRQACRLSTPVRTPTAWGRTAARPFGYCRATSPVSRPRVARPATGARPHWHPGPKQAFHAVSRPLATSPPGSLATLHVIELALALCANLGDDVPRVDPNPLLRALPHGP